MSLLDWLGRRDAIATLLYLHDHPGIYRYSIPSEGDRHDRIQEGLRNGLIEVYNGTKARSLEQLYLTAKGRQVVWTLYDLNKEVRM